MQLLAVRVAVRADVKDFIAETLLDSTVNDVIKVETAHCLFERNEDMTIFLVLCDMFKKFVYKKLEVGRTKRKAFVYAYALCAARFCLLGKDHCAKFNRAAADIYRALEAKDMFSVITDKDSLACAIYFWAEKGKKELNQAAELFRTDEKKVAAVLNAVTGEEQNETH